MNSKSGYGNNKISKITVMMGDEEKTKRSDREVKREQARLRKVEEQKRKAGEEEAQDIKEEGPGATRIEEGDMWGDVEGGRGNGQTLRDREEAWVGLSFGEGWNGKEEEKDC